MTPCKAAHGQLLRYYNEELLYMRESAGEFAQMHPKIARRLGMQGQEVADPYVERLIESFSFMSARMRIKLDAEFPRECLVGVLVRVLKNGFVGEQEAFAAIVRNVRPCHFL